jgi:GTP-binding protein
VRGELAAYGAGLAEKPEILALNKADALDDAARIAKTDALAAVAGRTPRLVSAVSGEGVNALLRAAYTEVIRPRPAPAEAIAPGQWRP